VFSPAPVMVFKLKQGWLSRSVLAELRLQDIRVHGMGALA
jgi:hypothetical protein